MKLGINVLLLGCIIIGIVIALVQAMTMPCIADACNPGLYAGEVLKYGSWQYFLPVNDPYLLDYALNIGASLVFGLYNVQTLFIVSFIVYVGIVVAAGFLVRRLAGDTAGLAAMALVANVPNACLQQMIYPVWHGSTVLLILIALNVYVSDIRPTIKYLLLGTVSLFAVYSDSIALPMLILPITAISLYNTTRYKSKDYLNGLTCFTAGITGYFFKADGGEIWANGPRLITAGGLDKVLDLSPDPMAVIDFLLNLMLKAGGPLMHTIIIFGISLAFNKKSKFLNAFLGLSTVSMLAGFTILEAGGDLGRYLYPLIIFAMLPIATIKIDKKIFGIIMIVPLIICAGIADNIVHVALDNHDPNLKDRQLITWLKNNNVTTGAADYWPANLIRYMSGDKIVFCPAYVSNGELCYLTLNTAQRWDEGWPPTTLFTYGDDDPVYNWANSINITPSEILVYYGYHTPATKAECVNITIYRYNVTLPIKSIVDVKKFEDDGVKPV
jgi:hypothetical protein